MATSNITVLEHCHLAPPPDAPTKQTLPLLHFDMIFLHLQPLKNLLFFDNTCSKFHFLETIVPKLKASLSTTLKHFLPLTSNIHFPLTTSSERPISRYVTGDSVPLTVAESSSDFSSLMSNNSRNADEFYDLTPQLPQLDRSASDFIKIPVAAFQVTSFPDKGICIGLTSHHAIGDGATIMHFLHVWASVAKYDGDAHLLASGEKYLPFYDRSDVEDPNGLDSIRWNQMKRMFNPSVSCSTISAPINNVRGTFILTGANIEKLKNSVVDGSQYSSFIVVCAHVWSCLAKSAGEEVCDDDETEYMTTAADCRARLNPPLPLNYFGNCLASVVAGLSHKKLKGSDGFLNAAQAISDAIGNTVHGNKNGILDGSENRLMEVRKLAGKRVLRVAGSPRFDPYGADYGWGRPKKLEALPTDNHNRTISLCKSREFQGVEVGLLMTQSKMDSFAAIFNKGLLTEETSMPRVHDLQIQLMERKIEG